MGSQLGGEKRALYSEVPVSARRYGRCRTEFDGGPTLFSQADWALGPACAEILLRQRPGASLAPGPT
jgi:hypothetical protein